MTDDERRPGAGRDTSLIAVWASQVVDDPTNKSRRDLGADEAEFGIFAQPPVPEGAVWRSNVQHFNGRCVLRSLFAERDFRTGQTLIGSITETVLYQHYLS